MSIKLKRVAAVAIPWAIICIAVFAAFLYMFAQFERKVITQGAYLGLAIGDTKKDVYRQVSSALAELSPSDSRAFVEIEVDSAVAGILGMSSGRHAIVQHGLEPAGFEYFRKTDQWRFHIGASYMNLLTLKFCDDRLCQITRMKKPFELP